MSAATIVDSPGRVLDPRKFNRQGTVLLENLADGEGDPCSYLYTNPAAVIQCTTSDMVPSCLEQIEDHTERGFHAAGFLSYEAGSAWIPGAAAAHLNGFPLLWFGFYEKAERFTGPLILPNSDHADETVHHTLAVSRQEYEAGIASIRDHIRDGDTYQVNYTTRMRFGWRHGAWQLYLRLRRTQPVPYAAFMNCGSYSVVSLSPELFLTKRGRLLTARPMKGTAPRGADLSSDQRIARWLQADPKNRSENLMIVDLMRNDLGRLSEIGGVTVREPFCIRSYRTLHQMTTDVRCTLREGIGLSEIAKATFPPGSVTGAPKISTMNIISRLESSPRKIYTGAIGAVDPAGDMTMSVAIRTILCTASGACEMGIGSGIVWDSEADSEYAETVLKGRFIDPPPTDEVDLFETVLLEKKGTLLWIEEHLHRLESSAAALGYPFSRSRSQAAVFGKLESGISGPAIMRLVLSRTGDISVQFLPLAEIWQEPARVVLSSVRTDPDDSLLRHKTTRRHLYDRELAMARGKGYLETVFTNTLGFLTEGAFTNLFVLAEEGWVTPSIRCGLLPGIWRDKFMQSTGAMATRLEPGTLQTARKVIIGNSVRGAMEVNEVVDAEGLTLYRKRA